MFCDWNQVGKDVYYRKHELYALEWGGGMNLNSFSVSPATYAGPIALTRNDAKHSAKAAIMVFVFSSSGRKISSFKWTSGFLSCLVWSSKEDLICVQQDGSVLMYDIFGKFLRTFTVAQEATKCVVVDSAQVIHSDGQDRKTSLVVHCHSNVFYAIMDVYQPHSKKTFTSCPAGEVFCWCSFQESEQIHILVSMANRLTILKQNIGQVVKPDWSAENVDITAMAVSGNGRHLALFSSSGLLWMGSSDLRITYCQYNTASHVRPKQIVWCGTSGVVLLWDVTFEIVTTNGDSVSYFCESASCLIADLDAVRILTPTAHEMLQKVPQVVLEVLGVGSLAPGALLLEAYRELKERSIRTTDYLSMIKDNMEDAVNQCIEAAQYEYGPEIQKMLLKAALFGKGFLSEYDGDKVHKTVSTLRVLNIVRNPVVGLPYTWLQLEDVGFQRLLDQLVQRKMYPVALQMASFLKNLLSSPLGCANILSHWAGYKVMQKPLMKSEDQTAKEIHTKLGYSRGINYIEIAKKAQQAGHKQLAVKLAEYECDASKQIQFLIHLGEDQIALKKSLQSGDTDLTLTILMRLRQKMSMADFLMLLRNFQVALSLYLCTCGDFDVEQYQDILVQEDNFQMLAALRITEAYHTERLDLHQALLHAASNFLQKARDEVSCQLIDDQIRLLKRQVCLEESHHKSYLHLSLHSTISQLVKDRLMQEAEKMRTEFRVSDRRYWWVRLGAHCEAGQWSELEEFSKNKKNPIGFEPFVDACLQHGRVDEAQKYIPSIKEENRYKYLSKCGLSDA